MSKKQVISIFTFFFLVSGAMLTPVVLPYFTLETGSVEAPPITGPDSLRIYAKALGDQSQRNADRLKTSLFFAKWFVLSFAVFFTSGLSLLGFLILRIIEILRGKIEKQQFTPHK